jgi:hypothetical protein
MDREPATESVGKGHVSSHEEKIPDHIEDPDVTIGSRAHRHEVVWIALKRC